MVSSECLASGSVCHAWGNGAKCLGADMQRLNFSQGAMPHDLVVLTMERIGKQGLSALRAHTVLRRPHRLLTACG